MFQNCAMLGRNGAYIFSERPEGDGEDMREFTNNFYGRIAWKEIRDATMRRDHWLCQDCLKKGMYVPAEEVHHIIPLTPENINDERISLNMSNLISLCRECHKQRHIAMAERKGKEQNLGERRRRRYTVDAFGNVTIRDDFPQKNSV